MLKIRLVTFFMAAFTLLVGQVLTQSAIARDKDTLVWIEPYKQYTQRLEPNDDYAVNVTLFETTYERLFDYDPALWGKETPVHPRLAKSYEESADGMIHTIHLRKGVKFHTGRELTAEAVKSSIERGMARTLGMHTQYEAIDKIEVVDKYTLRFKLKHPTPLEAKLSGFYSCWIMDTKAVEEHGEGWLAEGHSVGTGPYVITKTEPGQYTLVEKFDDYWGGWEGPHFDKVLFKTVIEETTTMMMMDKGEADIANVLTGKSVRYFEKNPNIYLINDRVAPICFFFIFPNCRRAPLDDKLVRQAFTYTIPYSKIEDDLLTAKPVSYEPPFWWGACEKGELKPFEFNLKKAEELFTKAGYPREERLKWRTFEIVTSPSPAKVEVANTWTAQLNKMGIKVRISQMEFGSLFERVGATDVSRRPDFFVQGSGSDMPPMGVLQFIVPYHEPMAQDFSHYHNEALEARLYKAITLMPLNEKLAKEIYTGVQHTLREEVPFWPVACWTNWMALNKTVGYRLGEKPIMEAYWYLEPYKLYRKK